MWLLVPLLIGLAFAVPLFILMRWQRPQVPLATATLGAALICLGLASLTSFSHWAREHSPNRGEQE